MCQKCLDSAHEFFPKATKEQCADIVQGATFFPIVGHDTVHGHLKELSRRCGDQWEQVFLEADKMLEEEMREIQQGRGATEDIF